MKIFAIIFFSLSFVIVLSACGKKAPPKPPVSKKLSGDFVVSNYFGLEANILKLQ